MESVNYSTDCIN